MQATKQALDDRRAWTVNGRFLTQRTTGVQRYAQEILTALDDLLGLDDASGVRIQTLVPPGLGARPHLSNMSIRETRVGSGHAWDQFVLPLYAGRRILNLGNTSPLLARDCIVCIHDVNTFILPESYSAAFGRAYRALLPVIGKTAKRVATVSQFSAEMLVKYGICDRSKIFVAPNGHEHALRWDPRRADNRAIASLRRPYVLLIGSQAKHKNISIVLEQAEYLDAAGIDIVVVGGTATIFTSGKLDAGYSNIRSMGYVSDDDLAALYERALCLAFPSKTEGFGIPSLEGMARGCPVISSNAASLVEVGGDAVLYVDPSDGEGWRNAILKLASNEALRQSMIVEGYRRAASFSWKRSAELYLEEMLRLSFPVRRR